MSWYLTKNVDGAQQEENGMEDSYQKENNNAEKEEAGSRRTVRETKFTWKVIEK